MKWIYAVLVLAGCSSGSVREPDPISERAPAAVFEDLVSKIDFEKFNALSFNGKLSEIQKITSVMKSQMRDRANPWYLILDNFDQCLKRVVTLSSDQWQTVSRIVACHNVMATLENQLQGMIIVEKESNLNQQGFKVLDRFRSGIDKNVREQFAAAERQASHKENDLFAKYLVAKNLAFNIDRNLRFFTNVNREERQKFSALMKRIYSRTWESVAADPNLRGTVDQLKKSFDWGLAQRRLKNLELPDSSEVEGTLDQFEKVTQVQVGFALLDRLFR